MDKTIKPTKLIADEMAITERNLARVGKFGVALVALALLCWLVLLYKLRTLVSALNSAETKLVFICFGLTALIAITGFAFTQIANYKQAIYNWREQSMREYIERQKR
jgi:hypothetical protein